MEGECDDLPYAEGAAVRMHANNVHINTRAPHARHVHLINLSSFAFILVQEGLLLLRCVTRTMSRKMSGTLCFLIGYWQQPFHFVPPACI